VLKKRAIRRRMCGRKKKHKKEWHAEAHQEELFRRKGDIVKVYLCRWCGYYHVGH